MRGRPVAEFDLSDQHGSAATPARFHGKYPWYFFGFTHCRMVCPRALARMSTVLDRMGERAGLIQPVYVTVDPERDTPEVLATFLATGYPRFIGLTGTPEQITAAKTGFHVFARRTDDPGDPDGYAVPHSAFSYLMDPRGEYLAHFTDAVDVEELTERLAALLA